MRTQKLGIIGLGHVGEHVLAAASYSHLFGEIVAIDVREGKAYGEALDQTHATGLNSRSNAKIYQGDYEDLADADIIIVAVTYVYPDGHVPADRQDLLVNNAGIIRDIMTRICQVTKEAILIFITNPVDTVTHMAMNEFDYPKERIMGTGCMLDSIRMKQILGQHYGVDPKSVSAYMMGEHGYSSLPILSKTTIAGIPYSDLPEHYPNVHHMSPDEMQEKVVQAAYEVFDNKAGVTNAAIGQVAIDLARAILLDEKAIFNISTVFYDGEYDTQKPVAFSTPTVVGRQGWEKRFIIPLNDWEKEKLAASVASIRKNTDLAESLLK